jgi:hypothetical protein
MPDGSAARPPRSLAIEAIAAFGDEVEVVVVGSPHRNTDGDWMVRVLARRLPDEEETILSLPIGVQPLLSSGRVFLEGRRIDSARNGLISDFVIPDLSDLSRNAPSAVHSCLRGSKPMSALFLKPTTLMQRTSMSR